MANYQPQDKYFKRAREQGLPSRAAFKLSELLQRYRLLRPRMRVLHLGMRAGRMAGRARPNDRRRLPRGGD